MSLVGAFAASHAPGITGRPSLPPAAESEPIFRAYAELRSRLEATRPDVLVVVSPEHWANFFLDNMPSFCIGIADEFFGPTDEKFVNINRRMAAQIPKAELVVVPEAGHTVHLEQPERFREIVLGLCRDGVTGLYFPTGEK